MRGVLSATARPSPAVTAVTVRDQDHHPCYVAAAAVSRICAQKFTSSDNVVGLARATRGCTGPRSSAATRAQPTTRELSGVWRSVIL